MDLAKILSKTEYEVAAEITKGYSIKEIAAMRFNSVDTIHTHARRIRKKLDARCAVDVARKFILSLDNPKRYFAAIACLIIQFHIIAVDTTMDLRKPVKTHKTFKAKTARKF